MAQAHPTNKQLAAYAGGSLSEGMSLLVASHMTFCPVCRDRVEIYETLGASSFIGSDTDGMKPPALDAVMDRLDTADAALSAKSANAGPLPFPIWREVKKSIDDLPWKFRMPGLHECQLEGFDGEQVSLLRVKPGTGMLHHTHEGDEATLILSGEMEDGDVVYRKGDVALADEDDDHHPRVIGTEVCYCLIVMSGNVRFTGPVSRFLNLLSR